MKEVLQAVASEAGRSRVDYIVGRSSHGIIYAWADYEEGISVLPLLFVEPNGSITRADELLVRSDD